jgi:hypothetical protein
MVQLPAAGLGEGGAALRPVGHVGELGPRDEPSLESLAVAEDGIHVRIRPREHDGRPARQAGMQIAQRFSRVVPLDRPKRPGEDRELARQQARADAGDVDILPATIGRWDFIAVGHVLGLSHLPLAL